MWRSTALTDSKGVVARDMGLLKGSEGRVVLEPGAFFHLTEDKLSVI